MLYRTRYGEAAQRILQRFGAGEAAIVAIEVLIQTAEKAVKSRETEELAKQTCRGLHMDKPGSGVVCAKCFDAAFRGATDRAISGDELAKGRKLEDRENPLAGAEGGDPAALGAGRAGAGMQGEAAPAIDREAIERDVAGMLGQRDKER